MKTWTASVPVVRVETLLPPEQGAAASAAGATVIDLRSPAEFAEDHIPGAHNVPLFDDEGRAVVGLFYKQFSPEAAFEEARALAVERIKGLVDRIVALAGSAGRVHESAQQLQQSLIEATSGGLARLEQQLSAEVVDSLPPSSVVLHCWRGGMRSRSVVGFLRGLGLDTVYGLEGGYKAYRRHCMDSIAAFHPPRAFVLRGLTGVGKTLVLRALARRRPGWVLDLEGLAGHRSSLLGMVGLEPVNQKTFDTRTFERLREGFGEAVVLEGESRRVGDVIVPASIWSAMQGADNIELVASTPRRVQVLIEDYLAEPDARAHLRRQLAAVEARMEKKVALIELFDAGNESEVVRQLLEHYYDPLYRHSERDKHYEVRVDASDPERAAGEIEAWIASRG